MTRKVKDNKKTLKQSREFISVPKMALLETDGKTVNSRVEKVGMLHRYSKYRRKEAGGCLCHRQCYGWHIKPTVCNAGGCVAA